MAFTPRTYEQIVNDMIAYVQANTDISDFSVGSVARTLIEAAALEDDEQYFQMSQILESFSIFSATGERLDRRVADYGISRIPAQAAVGKLKFFDSNLLRDSVAVDAAVGASSLLVFDSSRFPVSGFPYTIRIAEGTARVQDIAVTANDPDTGTFTLGGTLAFTATVNDRVSLVTGSVSHTITIGQQIQVPPTSSEAARVYTTQEQAFIEAGNYLSNAVLAKATTSGTNGNVGLSRVTQFVGNPPFTGAGVINTTTMAGGRAVETDDILVRRAVDTIPSLSRGTPLALISAALGIEDTSTGQRVSSANIVEDFDAGEVICYIDDGTGLSPDTVNLPVNNTSGAQVASDPSITLVSATDFPTAGKLWISGSVGATPFDELIGYESKDTNVLTLDSGGLANSYDAGATVQLIDIMTTSTETGQTRFRLQNFPIVRGSEVLYKKELTDSTFQQITRDTDYKLNKGTGDVILTNAYSAGTQLIAHYSYYTNLVALVQKTLDGDPNDLVNFPGVRAAGIFLTVEAPVIKRITIRVSLTAQKGFAEEDLLAPVRSNIEQYISSLGIGEDVVTSKIIDVAHDVNGVDSVSVLQPTAVLTTVLENELPVPFASDGSSLVTIL